MCADVHGLLHHLEFSSNLKQPPEQHSSHLCAYRPFSVLRATHLSAHFRQKGSIYAVDVREDGGHVRLQLAARCGFFFIHCGHISNGVWLIGEVGAEEPFFFVMLGFGLAREWGFGVFGGGGSVPEFHGAIWLSCPLLHIYSVIF